MNEHRWIRIASYPSNHEASLALSVLEGSGIPAKVFNQHALGAMPHLSQLIMADLMVDESSVKDALEILGIDQNTALPSQENGGQTHSDLQQALRFKAARKVIWIGIVLTGLAAIAFLIFFLKDPSQS